MYKKIYLLFYLFLSSGFLIAQPIADFSASALAGCAPTVINFTNLSTGAQSYSWNMGNGTSSSETNPSVQYIKPGTFTVILTATNAQGSAQKSIQITIYKPPTTLFTVDDSLGCRPHTVKFSDLSVQGTGVLTKWRWDFGDGTIDSTNQFPQHTYNIPATYSINLQVYDDKGCRTPFEKKNFIQVGEPPTVSLSASPIHACAPPLTVNFTDKSASTTGIINKWEWDFGDLGTSTDQNPSHTYNAYGIFSPNIKVTDNLGCVGSYTASNYIEVVDFKSDFSIDSVNLCNRLQVTFNDLSTPKPAVWNWTFGALGTGAGQTVSYPFLSSGTYKINLISSDNYGCTDDTFKTFTYLKLKPEYSIDTSYACSVPFPVTFTNSSIGVQPLSYNWIMGDSTNMVTKKDTVFPFTTTRDVPKKDFPIKLYVTDAFGCVDSIVNQDVIKLNLPKVTTSQTRVDGCIPVISDFSFITESLEPIVDVKWNFGDPVSGANNLSSLDAPTHSYDSVGVFTGKIVITNSLGCKDSVTFDTRAGIKPEYKSFQTLDPYTKLLDTNFCYKDSIYVQDSSGWITPRFIGNPLYTLNFFSYQFYAGDTMDFSYNATFPNSIDAPNGYFYFDDGIARDQDTIGYTVGLNGCFVDTFKVIDILGPVAIPAYSDLASCTFPYKLKFSDSLSYGGGTFSGWDITYLKDNSNSFFPANDDSINLSKPGLYTVEMSYNDALGTQCQNTQIDTFRVDSVYINYTVNPSYSCLPNNRFQLNDLSTSLIGDVTNWLWTFGDGNTLLNVSTQGFEMLTADDQKGGMNGGTYSAPYHVYSDTGSYIIKLDVTTIINRPPFQPIVKNCYYSFSDTVEVQNVFPAFSMNDSQGNVDSSGCKPFEVTLLDTSVFTSKIEYQIWNYGDGSLPDTFDVITSPPHIYKNLGTYPVKMVLIDTMGCRDSLTKSAYIEVTYPYPSFSSPRYGCDSATINFTNTSSPLSQLNYLWRFGNGDTSIVTNPSQIFNVADTMQVTLYAIDKNGCDSTSDPLDLFITDLPKIKFGVDKIEVDCPPHEARFWDSSRTYLDAARYYWTFGDSSFSTQPSPVHVYYRAGFYDVALIITDTIIGCSNTLLQDSLIIVHGPSGKFDYSPKTGCAPLDVTYKATDTLNVASFIWDFGNGNVDTTTADELTFTYETGGLFYPNLSLDDGIGCKVPMQHDSILINMPIADFTRDSATKGFNTPNVDFVNLSKKAVTYEWDFGDPASGSENTSTATHPNHTYHESGTYLVRLIALNQDGCRDTTEKPIEAYVSVTPPSAFTPDGDGINDLFFVKGLNLNSTLSIFDRWGVKLLEKPDYTNDWDGTDANGKPLTDGVYYYLLFDATTKESKGGYLLLIRKK
ncbi:MAG: hypothetical protein A3H98_07720 [Bacteroidetes bacterium RIFCSPLOWO2_02_FULL_36_8]|nr:MAG: hypothetical protein A3H98_07720 [Bacteroidetes bacterium RIFCSPLOWO2_02_FULL_36_8]OFY70626.1 MAG: hypothetical protein A3G23_07815 [Bacteroidetes bacterium RIFCSPLOWO2_12_FULL_37_12]